MEPGKPKGIERSYYLLALKIAGDFGATIAVPVVLLAWLGQKIDARLDTRPAFLIAGFATAALFSGWSIYHKAKRYGADYQRLNNTPRS